MSKAGYVVSRLAKNTFCRVTRHDALSTSQRLTHSRAITLTSQQPAKTKQPAANEEDEAEPEGPIKFSTSKASHRSWKVEKSLGSNFERPWWNVLPLSIACVAFLLWCVLRRETEVDAQLEKHLHEHMPGLHSQEEEE